MKRTVIAVTAAMLLASAPGTFAQEASDVCSRFADNGLRNISIKLSTRALLDRVHNRFCNETHDSMSAEAKAEFGFVVEMIPFDFGGSIGGSKEKHAKFCQDFKRSTQIETTDLEIANTLYGKAIDAWAKCVELTQKEVFLDASIPESRRFIDVFMRYTGPGGSVAFNGVETSEMACTQSGQPIGPATAGAITSAGSQVRCERTFSEETIGGIKSRYYPAAAVTVKTAAGILPIEFAEMIDEPARTELNSIKTSIIGLESRVREAMSSWSAGSQTTDILYDKIAFPEGKKNLDVLRDVGPLTCAEGSYAVGVSLQTTVHPGCNGCFAGVQLVCRTLASP